MRVFYRAMLEEGRTPADALRRAQIELWRSRRWHAPCYWAAFVPQGEPRRRLLAAGASYTGRPMPTPPPSPSLPRPALRGAGLALAAAAFASTLAAASVSEAPRVVSKDEILAAMQKSQGYELTATANGPRLQGEVLLRLIADAERTDAARRPLLVGHREWYEAFLERTQLPASRAPQYVRLSFEIGQDLLADYRRERVIEAVLQGPEPRHAANVRIYWEKAAGRPDQYSFDDTLSDPALRVTQSRVITYRLVGYGDRLWYAEIEGLRGRPTSGALGALFAVIGETTVVESWSASAPDDTQVARGHGRKWWFDRTETVTLRPSGRGDRGIPPGRPDLAALEKRLQEPLAIRFRPLDAR